MLERVKVFYYALRSAVSTLSNPRRWFVEMFGGGKSKSGVNVNEDTAVKVTAVFACIRLLSQTIASLPLHTYRRTKDGKERAYDHPLYYILHDLWNPECTSYMGRLIMMVNLLLTGRAFAEIVRNKAGAIIELWLFPSIGISPNATSKLRDFLRVYLDNAAFKYFIQSKCSTCNGSALKILKHLNQWFSHARLLV